MIWGRWCPCAGGGRSPGGGGQWQQGCGRERHLHISAPAPKPGAATSTSGWKVLSGPSLSLRPLPGKICEGRCLESQQDLHQLWDPRGETLPPPTKWASARPPELPCTCGEVRAPRRPPHSPSQRLHGPGQGGLCRGLIYGPAPGTCSSGPSRSAWSITLKVLQARGTINYLSLLAAVPVLNGAKGWETRPPSVTHRVADGELP